MNDYRRLAQHFQHPLLAELLAPIAGLLANRHLVVCGATGFVGTWLLAACHHLDSQGVRMRVTAVARSVPSSSAGGESFRWLHWVATDIRRLHIPDAVTFFIHAALSSQAGNEAEAASVMQIAVEGTISALAEARRHEANFLYVSSGAVYGDCADRSPHREDRFHPIDPRGPQSLYIEAKRAAESLCSVASRGGQPVVIARLFSVLGAGYRSHSHLAAVSLIQDALSGRPIRIRGDGQARRGFLYGAEMAAWLLRLMVHGEPGDAINVGNDNSVTIRQLAELIARECRRPDGDLVVEGVRDDRLRKDYVPNINHARERYGLAPQLSLEEAIYLTCSTWGDQ